MPLLRDFRFPIYSHELGVSCNCMPWLWYDGLLIHPQQKTSNAPVEGRNLESVIIRYLPNEQSGLKMPPAPWFPRSIKMAFPSHAAEPQHVSSDAEFVLEDYFRLKHVTIDAWPFWRSFRSTPRCVITMMHLKTSSSKWTTEMRVSASRPVRGPLRRNVGTGGYIYWIPSLRRFFV